MRAGDSKAKRTFINVKITQNLTDIIDENLKTGKVLNTMGFNSRRRFAQLAVAEKLKQLNLLSQRDLEELSQKNRCNRVAQVRK